MSDEDTPVEACWGSDIDTDHLGDVLIMMGERLKAEDDGIGLQTLDYSEHAAHDEFGTHELTIGYAKGGDTILGDPIRYTENETGDGGN